MTKILITGSLGQIGTDLAKELSKQYGVENIVLSDINKKDGIKNQFEELDVRDYDKISQIVKKHKITKIFHLAAILSANGEKNTKLCWDVNMNGLYNILEIARTHDTIQQIITPSSIAVFGDKSDKINTPQDTILSPSTMYGVTKVSGELLCEYYVNKFNIDVRSIRYPGLISYETLPGGGTTDYAVAIFFDAIKKGSYESFLSANTVLPMMYMPDAVRALIDLSNAKRENLNYTSYNLSALSFSVQDLANEIKKIIPNFEISYKPDYRQAIADSWPQTIDDSAARNDWNWKEEFSTIDMVKDMLNNIK